MASRKIEQQLETLDALRAFGLTDHTLTALRKALKDRVNLVVAKAASMTVLSGARDLIPDLLAAFDRLIDKGVEADPQCWGKNALGKALKDLGYDESAVFLRGLRHVQMEAVWGSRVDTAGTLRSICVLALLQCTDLTRDDKLWHQMRALTDIESTVRVEAARALEEMDGRDAALLLGLKARVGDREANVTGQALAALLAMQRQQAVPFVAEFLDSGEEGVQAEAALALGASREPAAMQVLIDYWRGLGGRPGEAILRGISASRQDVALDFLMSLVRDGVEREALGAMDALALHRDSADICARVGEAVGGREESALRNRFRLRFTAS